MRTPGVHVRDRRRRPTIRHPLPIDLRGNLRALAIGKAVELALFFALVISIGALLYRHSGDMYLYRLSSPERAFEAVAPAVLSPFYILPTLLLFAIRRPTIYAFVALFLAPSVMMSVAANTLSGWVDPQVFVITGSSVIASCASLSWILRFGLRAASGRTNIR